MQIGVDSFAAAYDDASLAVDASDRLRNLVEQIEHADQVGLDVFGIGEHHRREYLDSAPAVILGAAAARTHIRLTSAVTVLSSADPVRVFQNFATLDLPFSGGVSVATQEKAVWRIYGKLVCAGTRERTTSLNERSVAPLGSRASPEANCAKWQVTDVAKSLIERKSGLLLSVRQIRDHRIPKPVRKPNRRVRSPDKLQPWLRTGGWVYNHRRS